VKSAMDFMTQVHKDKLLDNREMIVEHAQVGPLMTPLLQARVLTKRQKDTIMSCITEEVKVECLLDMLPGLPDSAYSAFVEALRSTKQLHIVNLLEPVVRLPQPPQNNPNRCEPQLFIYFFVYI